jgi:hypothetical protein
MNKPTPQELGGMTVNERLVMLDLFDQWDKACRSRDRNQMIQILKQCAMNNQQSESTTDTLLANPKMYGY